MIYVELGLGKLRVVCYMFSAPCTAVCIPSPGLLLVLGAGWTVSLAHDGIVAESKAEYNLQRMKRTPEKSMYRLVQANLWP